MMHARPRRRRSIARWVLGIGMIVVVALGALFLRARSFDPGVPPPLSHLGGMMVTRPDGQRVALRQMLKPGVPTVINLWASWCGPCRLEAPTIVDLRERTGTGRANLLYLNVRDAGSSRDDLNAFLSSVDLPRDGYAVLPDDRIGALTGDGDVHIPRTLVFDRAGNGLASITGYKPAALARVVGLVQ